MSSAWLAMAESTPTESKGIQMLNCNTIDMWSSGMVGLLEINIIICINNTLVKALGGNVWGPFRLNIIQNLLSTVFEMRCDAL